MKAIWLILCIAASIAICQCEVVWKFVQQWPPSVCRESSGKISGTCKIPKDVDSWVIRNFWPNGPSFCNNASIYNPNNISSIRSKLEKFWPPLLGTAPPKTYDEYWEKEWRAHGTCTLPTLKGELEYFQKGLDFQQRFNFLQILKGDGILPSTSKSYNLTELNNSFTKALSGRPFKLTCSIDQVQNTKRQFIYQIMLCLNKTSFELIKCNRKDVQVKERSQLPPLESLYSEVRRVQPLASKPVYTMVQGDVSGLRPCNIAYDLFYPEFKRNL